MAQPRLTTEGLAHHYPGSFSMGPIDVNLGPGIHRLHGINGAGKTTLLRCLCGALLPREGTVRVNGGDPVHDHRARRDIAWLPADVDLPTFFTVDEAWEQAAALRGDGDWDGAVLRDALQVPGRLRLSRASAGQLKKAGWLSTLAADPVVLLLDEPFANLDTDAIALTAKWLDEMRKHRIILLIVHGDPPLTVDSEAVLEINTPLRWSS
ncbi:MAG: ATP-binding cassette domain-containing protein [Myxococcota bacterium]